MGEPLKAFIDGNCSVEDELHHRYWSSWFFSKEEIEKNSPSRKDGIDLRKESQLRMSYCSFLRDLGIRLGLPQVTIATAIMFCHRFYLRQSHAKNEWQIVATVCMFLASKADETPCGLDRIVVVAYETMHKRDPTAARRVRQKDFFEKQKALILIGERLLLSTLRFDFNIQHPYRPLLNALKKLGITQKEVRQVAWNYVNDWLWTTLCLQYKPHYIAAGSLFLATKLHNVRLPSEEGGYVWWHEFDINPQQLEVVIQQMKQLLGFNRRTSVIQPSIATNKDVYSSPDSVLNRPESSRSSSIQEPDVDITTHKPVDATDHDLTNISIAEKEKSSTEYRTEQRRRGFLKTQLQLLSIMRLWGGMWTE
ncbi:Cyclin, N-terminal domain [Musa troglodytarum]|uniref:Cyclin, N-terminal domain n=1 Tax=Musa troglodytarum TaxID=320322 RepID=A0A9E7HGH7_9LILI|nr:Cyclin, N-terminal domain [Musa troglodytarum]URE29531.1 Cyclin, N-terminal domain [Musa troglodytarum]URE29532.1 Cyclin, N-terminal domain [Musa troglodytarum]URE29535.1 Cyclin, N-terminal domain [Musa troglodytarum]